VRWSDSIIRALFNRKEPLMSIFASPRFLRNVLFADAASCIGSGGLQVLATATLADLMNLPASLLVGTGWFLLAYGATVAVIAIRDPLPHPLVWLLVVGNVGWAAGCAALLASGWLDPTRLGTLWILAQAGCVLVLAKLQWTGLRRGRAARMA
jgi:hypothetical protein